MQTTSKITLFVLILTATLGCGRKPHALEYGYFRIDLPEATYQTYNGTQPYSFDLSDLAKIEPIAGEPTWIDIDYPTLNATVHCSYKSLKTSNLDKLTEETRTLVYKHTIRADAISEDYYDNGEKRVFGVLYNIEGNAASSAQFYITDSVKHFVRGSLYFNHLPNADSIAPVNAFVVNDIRRLIETIRFND